MAELKIPNFDDRVCTVDWDRAFIDLDMSQYDSMTVANDIASVVFSFISLDDLQAPEVLEYEQYGDKYSSNAGWPSDKGFHYQSRTFQLMAFGHAWNMYAQGRRKECPMGFEDYKLLQWVLEEHKERGDSHYNLHKAPHYTAQLELVLKWFPRAYTKIDPTFLFQVIKEA